MASRRFGVSALLLGCAFPGAVGAQTVDYATLAETMGEPVTTSVIGKPQRASEAPASIVIITRDQIARSPARDIPGLLAAYAGVELNRWTAGQSDVAVRGGVQTYNARLLVLVNGRQVYLDHYGETDWNLLGVQLEEIQQIELVRGPASALFGYNAASGVVNIITSDALGGRAFSATGEVGNHGIARGSAAATIPLGREVGLRLSGGHSDEDERVIPPYLVSPEPRRVRSDTLSASLASNVASGTRLELSGGHSFNRQLELLPSQLLTTQHYRADNVGVRADQDMAWGSLSAKGYVNWLDVFYGSDGSGALGNVRFTNRTAVASASALVRLGADNTVRFEGEFRDNILRSPTALYASGVGYQVLAASAMADIHPVPTVDLSLAGRVDHLSLRQFGEVRLPAANSPADFGRGLTTLSFNAAIVWSLDERTRLRLNGGRGVQSPSLVDFGLRLSTKVAIPLPFPLFVDGDPRMAPAIVWSAEGAVTRDLGAAMRLDAGLFFNRTSDAIATPGGATLPQLTLIGGPALSLRFANVGSFDVVGAQLSLTAQRGPLQGRANYTWAHTTQNVNYPVYAFSPEQTTPEHIINLMASYESGRFLGSIVARYTSSTHQLGFSATQLVGLYPVADAVNLDAKVGLTLRHGLRIFAAGQNLTLVRGAAVSPIPADRRVRAGLELSL